MTKKAACIIFAVSLFVDQLTLCDSSYSFSDDFVYDSVSENHDSNELHCPSDRIISLVACDSFPLSTNNFRRCKREFIAERNSEVSLYIHHKSSEVSFASYFIYYEKCASEGCHDYSLLTENNEECYITHQLHRSGKLDIQLLQLRLGLVIFWNDTSNDNCFKRPELNKFKRCNVTKYDSILEPTNESEENYDEIEQPVIVNEYFMSCPIQCFCGLGYQEYYTTCKNRKEIALLVYNNYVEGLRFQGDYNIYYVSQAAF